MPTSTTRSLTSTAPTATGVAVTAKPNHGRALYLDNLRILLISLVVVQHLSVTYGATGSWYYRDPATDTVAGAILMLWNAPGQAAGMGLFFLISGYFTPGSYDRKGVRAYLRDRFVRLGIPLVVYVLLLDPLVGYLAHGHQGSYWSGYGDYLSHLRGVTGPVWFIAVLLIFTLCYAAWRELAKQRLPGMNRLIELPSSGVILAYALALGATTFALRIWWPVTVIFQPLNVSVSYLPQYASMFALGLLAYRGDWFSKLTPGMAKTWALVMLIALVVLVVLGVPLAMSGAGRSGVDPGTQIAGGWRLMAFTYAMWEPFILVGGSIGLLVLFRERFNQQGRLAREASASAYSVYLLHPLIVVPFCVAFQPVALYPLLKFFIATLIALPLCFIVSAGVRRIPVLNRAL